MSSTPTCDYKPGDREQIDFIDLAQPMQSYAIKTKFSCMDLDAISAMDTGMLMDTDWRQI
jgi:hypothetical protein